MARQRVTITSVASRAGVSIGTVSNVLNGRTPVSPKRKALVLEAIRELGFNRSLLAKSMRLQRSAVVGLCMPFATFANFSALIDSLEERASDADHELMQVLSRQDPVKEFARIQRLVAHKVGGILLVPSLKPRAILDFLHANGMPTVIMNRPIVKESRFDQVSMDHGSTMFQIASLMIERGHRSIVLAVQFPSLSVTRQRIASMRRAATRAARSTTTGVFVCGDDPATFVSRLGDAISSAPKPLAVIASNSTMASWIIRALQKLNVRYPGDVSLLTLDEPEWAEIVRPTLSSVRQPISHISQIAWDLLAARMNGSRTPPQRIALDAEIVLRDSISQI